MADINYYKVPSSTSTSFGYCSGGTSGNINYSNTSFGAYSLNCISASGTDNTAIGVYTLYHISDGMWNVGIGNSAGYNLTTTNDNILVGYAAGTYLTGESNVGIGSHVFGASTTVDNNVGMGTNTFYSLTTGCNNTTIGYQGSQSVTSGCYNTALGSNALPSLSTCSFSIGIGFNSGYGLNESGRLYLGAPSSCTNCCIACICSAVNSITTYSDVNFKYDIKELTEGLTFLKKIDTITYYTDPLKERNNDSERKIGFSAQRLEEIICNESEGIKEISKSFVSKTDSKTGSKNDPQYGISYGNFIPLIINAIKQIDNRLIFIESSK